MHVPAKIVLVKPCVYACTVPDDISSHISDHLEIDHPDFLYIPQFMYGQAI